VAVTDHCPEALARGHQRPPFNPPSPGGYGGTGKPSAVPKDYSWPSLLARVERRLSVVEELEPVVSANLQPASSLRQSILQKAFTGELV